MMHPTGNPRRPTASAKKGLVGRIMLCFALMLTASLFPLLANADSAMVRVQASQGPFTITLFTPAEVSRGARTDVTVMVQRRDSGEVVMDADVEIGFVPPVGASFNPHDLVCGPGNGVPVGLQGHPTALVATHAQAANKLLYGASVVFPGEGNWQLRATVRRGSQAAGASCALPVSRPPSRLASVWPCLALPPVAIALFACNQWLRQRQRGNLSNEFAL
jgi:hypothetical protein